MRLFLTIFLSGSLTLHAQMCPCEFNSGSGEKILRNEIGPNLLNANEVLINFNAYAGRPVYLLGYVNGLMYKRHFNTFSLRAGFDFFDYNYKYEASSSKGYNLNNGESTGQDFRIGIEKTFSGKKLQPYAAADFLLSKGTFKGISEGNDSIQSYRLPYEFSLNAFGLSPAVGLKYRPFRHFSVSVEASLSIIYYETYNTSGAYPKESGMEVLANPLRALTVNYHF